MAAVVVAVHLRRGDQGRCGRCRRRCPGYDRGEGRRRWRHRRHLDLGTVQSFIEAEAPRVRCPEHGVVVAWVPWARHGAGHTRAFDDTVAWLAVRTAKSAVMELIRVAWRTVGRSSPGSVPTPRPASTASTGCYGSGSTRSATSAAIATSPWWWTTTAVGWSGRPWGGTRRPAPVLRRPRGRPVVPPSVWCANAAGWIATVWRSVSRTPPAAWIRSTSLLAPRPSTRSAARSGTRPDGAARRPSPVSSREHVSRSGRTPRT